MPTIVMPENVFVSGSFTVAVDEVYVSGGDPTLGGSSFRLQSTGDGLPVNVVFINHGEIRLGGPFGGRAFWANNAPGIVDNRGKVIVTADMYDSWGLYSSNWSPNVINSGLWQVTAAGYAYGIETHSTGGFVENSGDWIVSGDTVAFGVLFYNSNSFENTGDFTVTSLNGPATGIQISRFDNAMFHNAGTITVSGGAGSIGLKVEGVNTGIPITAPNIVNEGSITADVAIFAFSNPGATPQFTVEWVFNSGVISGGIDLGLGKDVVENRGVIAGDILMGDQDDLVDNTGGGVVNGLVDLGYGDDGFRGADGVDVVNGRHGNDTLRGGGGNDLLVGAHGDDLIEGGAGNDGLFGDAGRDRIVTQGGDYASGGFSDDRIESLDYTFAAIVGDEGFDTWALPAAGRVLDLSSVAASGRVAGIENIEVAAGDTVVVRASDVASITGGEELYVSGASGASAYLAGAWVEAGIVQVQNQTYVRYVSGNNTVYVDQDMTRAFGTNPPAAAGLDAIASGPAASIAGAIPGTELVGHIIDGLHELNSSFTVGADEIWQNLAGGQVFVVWAAGRADVLTNYGVIESRSPASTISTLPIIAIEANLGQLADNYGVISASALGAVDSYAFVADQEYGLINRAGGSIEAYAEAGDATAIFTTSMGVHVPELQNEGRIFAFSQSGFATGVLFLEAGNTANDGVIEAYGGNGAVGVDVSNLGGGVIVLVGTMTNRGQIRAAVAPDSAYYAIGVLVDQSTVVNTGLIEAEIAVLSSGFRRGVSSVINDGVIVGAIWQAFSSPALAGNGGVRLTNTGEIYGSIIADEALGISEITNTGLIAGDVLLGGGNDRYDATGGETLGVVFLGAGDDHGTGGAWMDIMIGDDGDDTLVGAGGDDFLVGGAGSDTLTADGGIDTVSAANDISAVTIHLAGGWAQDGWGAYDTLSGFENIIGSAFSDTLVGNDVGNGIVGGGGDDWIVGLGGDDVLEGGAGINVLIGGDGIDLASYESQTANLWVDMPAGVYSAAGVWDVFFESIEGVRGGSGNDSIFGNALDNRLEGGAGDDALIGGLGNDTLVGGAGFDWIVGGEGNDRIIGGSNDVDVLTGGAGADTFDLGAHAGWDVAFDFNTAEDRFALGGLQWLGFLTYDADGDGQQDDTLLGYAGGNFVALNVSGLTLAQWNALVDAPAGAEADEALMMAAVAPADDASAPLSRLQIPDMGWQQDLDAARRGFAPEVAVLHADDAPGWGLFG